MAKNTDYNKISSPYNSLLQRENDLTYEFGQETSTNKEQGASASSKSNDGTTQTKGGSVSTVALKSEGNAGDIWILNFIRSINWKPKTVGFYINGLTGYAEFSNIFVSGAINAVSGILGGFVLGADYIRDAADTMGLSSTITGGNDVRFWAGSSFAAKDTAPFRVMENGDVAMNNAIITGGAITGTALTPGSITYTELAYPPLNAPGDPTNPPAAIGQIFVNTSLGRIFISVNTHTDSDWILITGSPVPRNTLVGDTVTVTESVTMRTKANLLKFETVTITESFTANIV